MVQHFTLFNQRDCIFMTHMVFIHTVQPQFSELVQSRIQQTSRDNTQTPWFWMGLLIQYQIHALNKTISGPKWPKVLSPFLDIQWTMEFIIVGLHCKRKTKVWKWRPQSHLNQHIAVSTSWHAGYLYVLVLILSLSCFFFLS